ATAHAAPSTLSLHDALPTSTRPARPHAIGPGHGNCRAGARAPRGASTARPPKRSPSTARSAPHRPLTGAPAHPFPAASAALLRQDRKSTRLNSSHVKISYAV